MILSHVQTTISESAIQMRLANDPDPAKASVWIDFAIPIGDHLMVPTPNGTFHLGDIHTRQLSTIQLAALRYVRDAIGEETQRLGGLSRT